MYRVEEGSTGGYYQFCEDEADQDADLTQKAPASIPAFNT
jgi:hypothetical protein